MSKILEEPMLDAILKDASALSEIARRDGKTNPLSKRLAENCSKVAQIYALEQQVELLKSLEATSKDEIYGDIDLALFRITEQLKSLKDE